LWRGAVITLGDGTPVIGVATGVWVGTKTGSSFSFTPHELNPNHHVDGGWTKNNSEMGADDKLKPNVIWANMWASAQIARSPASASEALLFVPTGVDVAQAPNCDVKVALPDVRACGVLNGFRVFAFRSKTKDFQEMFPAIQPTTSDGKPNATGAIVHLSVSDPGKGPVMVHWYDLDVLTGEAVVRARVYFPDSTQQDLVLSQKDGKPRSFTLSAAQFLGDFKAGAGYSTTTTVKQGTGKFTAILGTKTVATFVPLWVEFAGGAIEAHTTDVTATMFASSQLPSTLPQPHVDQPIPIRKGPALPSVRRAMHSLAVTRERQPTNVSTRKYIRTLTRRN
jgi:hypothetical protein